MTGELLSRSRCYKLTSFRYQPESYDLYISRWPIYRPVVIAMRAVSIITQSIRYLGWYASPILTMSFNNDTWQRHSCASRIGRAGTHSLDPHGHAPSEFSNPGWLCTVLTHSSVKWHERAIDWLTQTIRSRGMAHVTDCACATNWNRIVPGRLLSS